MGDIINGINGLYKSGTYNGSSSATNALEKNIETSDLSTATSDELMVVCKDFESYFVEQMFKSMQKMIPKDDNQDKDSISSVFSSGSSSATNALTDYFKDELVSQYAKNATEGGQGYGIAQMLYEQMKRNYGITE